MDTAGPVKIIPRTGPRDLLNFVSSIFRLYFVYISSILRLNYV